MEEKDIAETFYAPFDLYRNGILDQILRGLLRGRAQMEDQFINDVMTNRMFEDPETGEFYLKASGKAKIFIEIIFVSSQKLE